MNKKILESQLRKIKGVRHLQVHAVTQDGKMIEVILFNDKVKSKKNSPR